MTFHNETFAKATISMVGAVFGYSVVANADVPTGECMMTRVNDRGILQPQQSAPVTFQTDADGTTLTLFGSHRDPQHEDRMEAKPRVYRLQRHTPRGSLRAWTFGDRDTAGTISMNYSGAARITLHVQGIDNVYLERFHGHCEGR